MAQELRILIVDDEPENRRLIQKIVHKIYPEAVIDEALDGIETERKIRALPPSLVILDVQLPGISGLEVCRTLRAEPSFRKMRILAISGVNADDSKNDALKAGADDFLGKPFAVKELAQKLEKLVLER